MAPLGQRHAGAFLAAGLVAMGWGASPALAGGAAGPGGHLVITEVAVDADAETITITGRDLDFGAPLKVVLGELGDITALCTPDFTPPQTIVCDFSATGLPPAGDYLLTVATGQGQSRSDEYDLTIAAAADQSPALTFYTRSAVATAAGGGGVETITAEALCDAGDVVTGGGFTHDVITPGTGHSTPVDITSAPNGSGTGWVGLIERIMPTGSTLTVWARCADLTP
jgi:hypothetical protein